MIGNRFLYFKTLQGFLDSLFDKGDSKSGIRPDAIVFIGKEKLIWTRGVFFGKSENKDPKNKGLFESHIILKQSVPSPEIGDWAVVKGADRWYIWSCEVAGVWMNTGQEFLIGVSTGSLNDAVQAGILNWLDQLNSIQLSVTTVDNKYQTITDLIYEILNQLPDDSLDSDWILNNLPDEVITKSNIHRNIPSIVITLDNINDFLPEPLTIDTQLNSESENPVQNKVVVQGLATLELSILSDIDYKINDKVDEIVSAADKSKGFFDNVEELEAAVPNPSIGDWAVVGVNNGWITYSCTTEGVWSSTGKAYQQAPIDLSAYAKKIDLSRYVLNNRFDALDGRVINLELDTTLSTEIDKLKVLVQNLYDTYVSWYLGQQELNENTDPTQQVIATNLVTLTTRQYEKLVENGQVIDNVYYFTYEPEPNAEWTFGDEFPIIFTDKWTFGGTFPVILTDRQTLWTFPITLT